MRKTLLLLAIGFAITVAYAVADVGHHFPDWVNTWTGFWPHGLAFGAFVLAPRAWRLPHGLLRALTAVLISDVVYALMVNWAIYHYEKTYTLGGALQGFTGAVLLMFGVGHLLKIKFRPQTFAWVLPLCAALGAVIVSTMLHGPGGWISFWVVQGAHLLWQAVVAVALARSVTHTEDTIPPSPAR